MRTLKSLTMTSAIKIPVSRKSSSQYVNASTTKFWVRFIPFSYHVRCMYQIHWYEPLLLPEKHNRRRSAYFTFDVEARLLLPISSTFYSRWPQRDFQRAYSFVRRLTASCAATPPRPQAATSRLFNGADSSKQQSSAISIVHSSQLGSNHCLLCSSLSN